MRRNKSRIPVIGLAAMALLLAAAPSRAGDGEQTIDDLKKTAPRVFIDCPRCDINYIRTEIQFVNYVRDRTEADVHILITQQDTGGGGREYTIAFIGLAGCAGLQNSLQFFTGKSETEDEVRKGLVQVLKLGLAPYVARTPMARMLSLSLNQQMRTPVIEDDWDFWVFNLSTRARLSGEEATKTNSLFANVSASRITPDSKFRLGLNAIFDESTYDYEDYRSVSSSRSGEVSGLYVRSIDDHWSAGGWIEVATSTYSNTDLAWHVHPTVEYNIFPYSQSTRRQLRLMYKVGFNSFRYMEMTIFDKVKENLWNQALSATLELREPWGSAWLSLEGSHYFNDIKLNRFEADGEVSLRLFRGLSLSVNGRYSSTRDQLGLRKSDVSIEDLLLRRTELASNYRYSLSVGVNYSFGSVFSQVVNPRFGGMHF